MKKHVSFISLIFILMINILIAGCNEKAPEQTDEFKYQIDRFAEFQILRYHIPGFENLDLRQKKLAYYLSEAAKCGRDITFDQNFKYNLLIRRTLDAIVSNYNGDKTSEDFEKFMVYTKKVWLANGIHHHYSTDKFVPGFSEEYFRTLVLETDASELPLQENQTVEELLDKIAPVIFDPALYAKKVESENGVYLVQKSASNFYEGVTLDEVNSYYKKHIDPTDQTPISYGLNTKVIKENGIVKELTYSEDGLYGEAISKITYWLVSET